MEKAEDCGRVWLKIIIIFACIVIADKASRLGTNPNNCLMGLTLCKT